MYYGSYYADVAIRADIYAEQAKKDKEFQEWQEKMIKKYEDENPDSKVLPQDKGGDAIPMKLTISRVSWVWTNSSLDGTSSSVEVGPYKTLYGCRDWLGSALYLHPRKCHIHPTSKNCRIIGNGYSYPAGTPYPPITQLPSGDCTEVDTPIPPNGYAYLRYHFLDEVEIVGGTWGRKKCERIRSLDASSGGVVGSGCFFQGNY